MIDNLFSPQLADIQSALSRTSRRNALLTGNLANVNTPGYKRKDIDFNIVLNEAMNPAGQHKQDMADEAAQRASDRVSLRVDGSNVDMEKEVMSLAETELRYEALTNVATNYFTNLKSVIREGK